MNASHALRNSFSHTEPCSISTIARTTGSMMSALVVVICPVGLTPLRSATMSMYCVMYSAYARTKRVRSRMRLSAPLR